MHGGAEKVLLNLVNNMDHEKFDITVQTLFDVGVNKQFLSDKVHYKTCYKKMFRGNTKYFKMFSPEKLYRKYIKDDYLQRMKKNFYKHIVLWMKQKKSIRDLIK